MPVLSPLKRVFPDESLPRITTLLFDPASTFEITPEPSLQAQGPPLAIEELLSSKTSPSTVEIPVAAQLIAVASRSVLSIVGLSNLILKMIDPVEPIEPESDSPVQALKRRRIIKRTKGKRPTTFFR
jgi:hypothetical protein